MKKFNKITEEKICKNLEKCPHFETCSQNLCPLDFDLKLRVGGEQDKCRWMREGRKRPFDSRGNLLRKRDISSTPDIKFRFMGGSRMPDALLKFVPEKNLECLNESSQKRWTEIKK